MFPAYSSTQFNPRIQWVNLVRQSVLLSQQLLSVTGQGTEIFSAAGLEAVITGLEAGQTIPGTDMTKETAIKYMAAFNAIMTAVNTPLTELGGITPKQALLSGELIP